MEMGLNLVTKPKLVTKLELRRQEREMEQEIDRCYDRIDELDNQEAEIQATLPELEKMARRQRMINLIPRQIRDILTSAKILRGMN
jgi:hypothetical protein